MSGDVIDCPKCGQRTTPTLRMADDRSSLRAPVRCHLCRLCGEVMYITGGTLTPAGRIAFFLVMAFACLTLALLVGRLTHPTLGWIVALAVTGEFWRRGWIGVLERLTWARGPRSFIHLEREP